MKRKGKAGPVLGQKTVPPPSPPVNQFVQPSKVTWYQRNAKQIEHLFTTLGAEFLCGCAWSLSLVFFTNEKLSRTQAIVLGLIVYAIALICIRGLSYVAISGSMVICDLIFGAEHDPPPMGSGRPRSMESRDSHYVLWARLFFQCAGTLIGYGWLLYLFGKKLEDGLYMVWRGLLVDDWAFWRLLAFQTVSHGFIAGLALREAQIFEPKGHAHFLFKMFRSGFWLIIITYPWGGISCSVLSFLWISRAFEGLSDLSVVGGLAMSMLAQAMLAYIVSECLHFENPRKK